MENRVGVFVCHCGTNIGGVVDIEDIVEFSKTLDSVVFVEDGRWICSVDYLDKIKDHIKEHDLNKVVVACCTPRTHEPTFKSALKEAGLNPFLLEFVSIREQCSWVHKDDPEKATQKAKDLISMGVAKAKLLKPAKETRISVGKECLVIGGGISGLTAASALAKQDFNVKLIEKEEKLGGLMANQNIIAPSESYAQDILKEKIKEIESRDNVEVLLNSKIKNIHGYVGNFNVEIQGNGETNEHKISTIIVASGMKEIPPEGKFGFGDNPKVVTHLQFEKMLLEGKLENVNNVTIINCVNSLNQERGCCNVGCLVSVKNAKALKKLNENANVYILYKDLNLRGTDVCYYQDAIGEHNINWIRYSHGKEPEVHEDEGGLNVLVHDFLLGEQIKIPSDLVVLTTGFSGNESTEDLKGLLKVSCDSDGFFQEAHVKLRPLDFANDGLYLAGCARSPKGIRESISEALGSAARASIPMKKGYVEAEGIVAEIDLENCNECGICFKVCPYGAIELQDKTPNVISALCKGCGSCAAECPKDTIDIVHFTDEQILAQVDAALAENPENKIVAFCCHWCALGAVDLAGVSRFQYPENIRVIRVMCAGRVDKAFVQTALEMRAGGVLVAGCEFPTCHYINGNFKCKDRIEKLKRKLEKEGQDAHKIWSVWLSAADGPKFASIAKDMVEKLGI